jgi:aminoglycoside phosphotransferase (APT) family kinase protein
MPTKPDRLSDEVLTHGEPHPGNLIQVGSRWMLVDWDTTLVAPPERDLWLLDPAMARSSTPTAGPRAGKYCRPCWTCTG